MIAYLKNIPVQQIEAYFRKTEIEVETLSAILTTLTQGLHTKDDCVWAANFLISLTKADNFELTISFAEDVDKENMQLVLSKIKALAGAECQRQVDEIQFKFE